MSEVGTKLDLARAYMDMGDPEGARNILEEVLHGRLGRAEAGSAAADRVAARLIATSGRAARRRPRVSTARRLRLADAAAGAAQPCRQRSSSSALSRSRGLTGRSSSARAARTRACTRAGRSPTSTPTPCAPLRGWVLGANTNLPRDISVAWVMPVPAHFHARYSAEARTYRYFIFNRCVRSALVEKRAAHIHRPLDHERMQRGGAGARSASMTSARSARRSARRSRRCAG